MPAETRKCTDCQGDLVEVKLIDKSPGGYKPGNSDVEYTTLDAKCSLWTGKFPVLGSVRAFMCESCGLLKLYGQPNENTAAL